MRETRISLPELALVAGTRALLGAGIGLLLADRLPEDRAQGRRLDASSSSALRPPSPSRSRSLGSGTIRLPDALGRARSV